MDVVVLNSSTLLYKGSVYSQFGAQEAASVGPDNGLLAGLAALTIVLVSFFFYPMMFVFGFLFSTEWSRRNGILHDETFYHSAEVVKALQLPGHSLPPPPPPPPPTSESPDRPSNLERPPPLGSSSTVTVEPGAGPPGVAKSGRAPARRVSVTPAYIPDPDPERAVTETQEAYKKKRLELAIGRARSLRMNRIVKGSATLASLTLGLLIPASIWMSSQTQIQLFQRWQGVGVLASAAVTAEVTGFFKEQINK